MEEISFCSVSLCGKIFCFRSWFLNTRFVLLLSGSSVYPTGGAGTPNEEVVISAEFWFWGEQELQRRLRTCWWAVKQTLVSAYPGPTHSELSFLHQAFPSMSEVRGHRPATQGDWSVGLFRFVLMDWFCWELVRHQIRVLETGKPQGRASVQTGNHWNQFSLLPDSRLSFCSTEPTSEKPPRRFWSSWFNHPALLVELC